ncbi:MAG: FkbM family methyltransferase [Clostridiales Family XIII bacterium]|jgi:FkbM family methyltransferase|nr:FkbM family methyltransferase [Clostridiales Family XIII bacterium]
MNYNYLFPFEKIKKGSRIVLYGGGLVGREYIRQIREKDYCEILYIVDRNCESICGSLDIDVFPPEKLLDKDFDCVVIASYWYADSIWLDLKAMKIPMTKVVSAFRLGLKPFASSGEDVAVAMIFKLLGKEKFSYIDVGANDPYKGSNTAYLYLNGCRGIDVEANPDIIDALRKERADNIVVNVGVGVQNGILPYYMFENNAFNTFSETVANAYQNGGKRFAGIRKIPVLTLFDIIEQYANGTWPEFLQIDIEGFDYEVLAGCDFSESGAPTVICTEASDRDIEQMNTMLDRKGYIPFHKTINNMIYLRKEVGRIISRNAGAISGFQSEQV